MYVAGMSTIYLHLVQRIYLWCDVLTKLLQQIERNNSHQNTPLEQQKVSRDLWTVKQTINKMKGQPVEFDSGSRTRNPLNGTR